MERKVKNDKEYYAEKELDGIVKVNRGKSKFQLNRSINRMIAKIKKEKPDIDGTRVNWGKSKNNKKKEEEMK